MERIPPISELINAVLRHALLVAVVLIGGAVGSVMYALSQPRLYQTAAVVQIAQQTIPDPSSGGPTNAAILTRLQIIEQRLMARDNLVRIIEDLELFSDTPEMSVNDRVQALRTSARVIQITDPALAWRPDVSPTALMIQVDSGDPEEAARVANTFVDNLVAQSRDLRSSQVGDTLAFFVSEEARIGAAITALDNEIAAFKRENAGSLPESLGAQRDQLLSLSDQALEIEQQIIEQQTAVRPDAARLARLTEQLNLLRTRIGLVEAEIAAAPEVERQFAALTRRLQQLTDQYQIVTRNKAEAEMGQMLESAEGSESFLVLERAQVPEHPIAPNRRRIVAAGGLAAAMVAGILVVLLELRNPVLRTAGQMQRRLGLRPVVAIPKIEIRAERVRRRLLWASGSALALLVTIVLVQIALGGA